MRAELAYRERLSSDGPARSAVAQQEMQDKIFAAGHLVQPADGRKMVQRRPERQQLGCKCGIVHGLCWFSLYC